MPINPKDKSAYLYYVCKDCFNTPDNCTCSMWKTSTHDLLPLYLIRIDINIQRHLQVLKSKGYITEFSCESHTPYDGVQIGFITDYFGDTLPMPEYFKKKLVKKRGSQNHKYCFIESKYCKTAKAADKMTDEEFEALKKKHLDSLYDWCVSLPSARELDPMECM